MKKLTVALVCLCAFSSRSLADGHADPAKCWPRWRGPDATGVAAKADPPTQWSESKNIRWKVDLPGLSHATPIIWGDRIYVQTAIPADGSNDAAKAADAGGLLDAEGALGLIALDPDASAAFALEQPDRPRRGGGGRGRGRGPGRRPQAPSVTHKFALLALDRASGKTVWDKTLCEEVPHESGHPDASQASNSPVTDGKHVYAHFGSRGLYCLDLDGNVKWEKEFGKMQTRNSFGEGSSPAVHGDTIVVNWDHEGGSFIVALDKKTGEQKWKMDRDEPTSWATPLVLEHDGKPQVVTAASNFVRSYDLKTGKLLWQCAGLTANVIPSPVAGLGMIFATSGHRGFSLMAIRYAGASGDISSSDAVVWRYEDSTPYVPSPLLYGNLLYVLKRNDGILSCFDAKTGKPHYAEQRLESISNIYASPVGAGEKVYITGRDGKTMVLKRSPKYEVLATNSLDDGFDASAAIAGDEIYLRGRKHLYCIAEQ